MEWRDDLFVRSFVARPGYAAPSTVTHYSRRISAKRSTEYDSCPDPDRCRLQRARSKNGRKVEAPSPKVVSCDQGETEIETQVANALGERQPDEVYENVNSANLRVEWRDGRDSIITARKTYCADATKRNMQ